MLMLLLTSEVRSGLGFSRWPTLPQIYVGGEFIGGSDILRRPMSLVIWRALLQMLDPN